MKNLWAPWRMAYIREKNPAGQACIFETGKDTTHEKKGLLLYRDDLVLVLLNRFPYTNGHLLLAPSRHVGDISALSPVEGGALFAMIRESVVILRRHKKPDGFNIGLNLGQVAGAGHPEHLHIHVVPRWDGDHNFMPVIAGIGTIPEHIDNTFDQLLPDFQELLAGKNN